MPYRFVLLIIAVGMLVHASDAPAIRAQHFTRLSTAGSLGTGQPGGWASAWGDYNADGFPDLLIVGPLNQLYRNNGDGTFTSVTVDHLTTTSLSQNSAVWTDANGDGFPDIYVSHLGPGTPIPAGQPLNPRVNFLYLNEGPPGYGLQRVQSGDLTTSLNMTWTSEFSDYDSDGDLDLFVWGDQGDEDLFYRNDGDGGFIRTTGQAFLDPGEFSAGGQLLDMDGDGDQDLLVVNFQNVNNELYRNLLVETGVATFEKVNSGTLTSDFEQDLVASWGDVDNDGDMDVFTPVWANRNDRFYRNDGDMQFLRLFDGPHVNDGGLSLGNALFDFDNDGFLDLYVTDQQSFDRLYRGGGDGRFSRLGGAAAGGIITQSAAGSDSGASVADFDNDGDLDVVAPTSGSSHKLYRNDTNNGYHWIQIDLEGVESNRPGVGAVVRVKADLNSEELAGVWQMRVVHGGATGDRAQSHQRLHFGLRNASRIDSVRVEWPSGAVDVLTDVAVDRFLIIREGSSPLSSGREHDPGAIDRIRLDPPYPNPAESWTRVSFQLDAMSDVRFDVFDLLGRSVEDVVLGVRAAGQHHISVDTGHLRPGTYLVRLRAESGSALLVEQTMLSVVR